MYVSVIRAVEQSSLCTVFGSSFFTIFLSLVSAVA